LPSPELAPRLLQPVALDLVRLLARRQVGELPRVRLGLAADRDLFLAEGVLPGLQLDVLRRDPLRLFLPHRLERVPGFRELGLYGLQARTLGVELLRAVLNVLVEPIRLGLELLLRQLVDRLVAVQTVTRRVRGDQGLVHLPLRLRDLVRAIAHVLLERRAPSFAPRRTRPPRTSSPPPSCVRPTPRVRPRGFRSPPRATTPAHGPR